MCGIAGWIGGSAGRDDLAAMTAALAHRGPDGDGAVLLDLGGGRRAGFGHRRLSIIDLADGAQPMSTADGALTVTFNGEIYNYIELRDELRALGARFRTGSDTEVLLAAWAIWGQGALDRLRGMYAFALHDRTTGAVHLVRDPFGKKPLYLAHAGGALVFASEIGAIRRHPAVSARVDPAAVRDYLVWRYVPGPRSFFDGIEKLPPGTILTWRDGVETRRRFRPLPETQAQEPWPLGEDPVAAMRALFARAVDIRLRSDVPVGMFLSGGLDSSAVLAAVVARGGSAGMVCYSVDCAGAGTAESETAEAAALARHFGLPFVPVALEPADIAGRIDALTRLRSAPMSEPADFAVHAMALRAARDVKVILTGEGADELFAGYPKHAIEAALPRLGPAALRRLAGRALAATGDRRLGILGRALAEADPRRRLVSWFGGLTEAECAALWHGPVPAHVPSADEDLPFAPLPGASALRAALHYDQASWLPDNVLERTDRMTMAASIEARVPFLDIDIAAFATRLPDHWRLRGRTGKRILRAAFADMLPAEVITRRKKGFPIPVGRWFRGPLQDSLRDRLCGPGPLADWLDGARVRRMVEDHVAGRARHDKAIWMLYTLDAFLRVEAEAA